MQVQGFEAGFCEGPDLQRAGAHVRARRARQRAIQKPVARIRECHLTPSKPSLAGVHLHGGPGAEQLLRMPRQGNRLHERVVRKGCDFL